jgi:hypothetical protein
MIITEEAKQRAAEELKKRTDESFASRGSSGMYASYFRKDVDISAWDPAVGTAKHIADVIPYQIGEKHPKVVTGESRVGAWDYVLVVWVHNNVGVTQDRYICPAFTFKQPCPICEEGRKHDRGQTDEEKKAWKMKYGTSKRNIYNVLVQDTEEEYAKGVQVFEVADFFMEEKLSPLAKGSSGRGEKNYSHWESGWSVMFIRNNDDMKSYTGHSLEPRVVVNNGIEQRYVLTEYLEFAYLLEDIVHWPTYEELYKAFWAGEGDPARRAVSDAAAASTTTSTAGGIRRRGSVAPAPASAPASAPAADNACRSGGTFAVDCGNIPRCDDCEQVLYEACLRAHEAAKEVEAPPTSPPATSAGTGRAGRVTSAPAPDAAPVSVRRRRPA